MFFNPNEAGWPGLEVAEDCRTVSIAHLIEFSDRAPKGNDRKRKRT